MVVMHSLVTLAAEEKTFNDFWHHQLRWARTYRTVRPLSLATILMHGRLGDRIAGGVAREFRRFRRLRIGDRSAACDGRRDHDAGRQDA